jgi:hypothetical protein
LKVRKCGLCLVRFVNHLGKWNSTYKIIKEQYTTGGNWVLGGVHQTVPALKLKENCIPWGLGLWLAFTIWLILAHFIIS